MSLSICSKATHLLQIPHNSTANEIPVCISRDAGIQYFIKGHCRLVDSSPALALSGGKTWLQDNEVIICHLIMLPNTSSTMLIELLSNAKICGSGEQVVNSYRSLMRPPPPINPIFSCTLTLL